MTTTPPIPAMLLAAGRGERMRPLTDSTPKPLLEVRGRALLEWHLRALAGAGVQRAVINTAWLGEQVSQRFGARFPRPHPSPLPHAGEGAAGAGVLSPRPRGGEGWGEGEAMGACSRPDPTAPRQISTVFALQRPPGKREQLSISYSHEGRDFGRALETAGGIARALPLLDAPVFWLAAGDVFAPDFRFDAAAAQRFAASDALAHLWLVPNPAHHPHGDFGLSPDGRVLNLPEGDPRPRHTYSTIALLRAELLAPPWCDIPPGNPQGLAAPLAPLLRRAMDAGRVTGELFTGQWVDVGTPERLEALSAGR